jgi:hypothetical protein
MSRPTAKASSPIRLSGSVYRKILRIDRVLRTTNSPEAEHEDLAHDEDRQGLEQGVGEVDQPGAARVHPDEPGQRGQAPEAEVVAGRGEEHDLERDQDEVGREPDRRVQQPADEHVVPAAAPHDRAGHRVGDQDRQRDDRADEQGEVQVGPAVERQHDAQQERDHDRERGDVDVHQRRIGGGGGPDQAGGFPGEQLLAGGRALRGGHEWLLPWGVSQRRAGSA